MSDGADMIASERLRQMADEGWTAIHDDRYEEDELIRAATSYLDGDRTGEIPPTEWPWAERWWKPTPDDRVRELVKAGALIAAEIDRLQRLA